MGPIRPMAPIKQIEIFLRPRTSLGPRDLRYDRNIELFRQDNQNTVVCTPDW